MPICEADPWRLQYFAAAACPENVRIPTEDPDGYAWHPRHRWVYNKLLVAESQGLPCGPHGLPPQAYPVFSKPIINLHGMGAGSRVLWNPGDYRRYEAPGHLWMQLLEGEHVSSDVAVEAGAARWFRHVRGTPAGEGTFDHWHVEPGHRPPLEDYCAQWIRTGLAGYTGMLNVETIGGRIIEAHLRFSDQWPDLYGVGWLDALIGLYAGGQWRFADTDRGDGYSVVLFGPHGPEYRHPPASFLETLRATPGVSSVQITFHEDRPAADHSMPPGGFRLAVVNCRALEVGYTVRARLASAFGLPAAAPMG